MASKPIEVKVVKNRLPAITSALGMRVQAEVMNTAMRIKSRAQIAMAEPKSGPTYRRFGKTHIASAPGEAPAVDTAALTGSLKVKSAGKYRAIVSVGVDYGAALEFGTTKMAARPFLGPAATAEKDLFEQRVNAILRELR